ncbi:MAG TPA: lysoplasmalogenase [Chitinophagaceae bacterium]|nr:lysoplasmalogenase [Chitinophagaceae bacterium]
MSKRSWITLFAIILIANITGGLLKNQWIDYISKPLIVVSIIAYFLSQTAETTYSLKKWILFALFFSWVGDILLMFQADNKLFFLLGLSCFLLAHVFYIIFFQSVRAREKIRPKVWLLLIVLVYYTPLVSFLSPHLGDMKLPVIIYGAVISLMLSLAIDMLFIPNRRAGQWMMTGALLFVLSDSVLAINQFYQSFPLAGVIIMLTYGLAQLFITEGAIKYITSVDKK